MCVVWLLLCDGQRQLSWGFGTVRDRTLCSRMAKSQAEWKMGCAQISAYPYELAVSTSDDHNQTPILAFLDSTKSSLSLKFNKMKCSAKTWAEHWARSQTAEELSVLIFGTSVFGTDLYLKCLGLRMA